MKRILKNLTMADLDRWAGETICRRGKKELKRVGHLRQTAADELVAWVSGTEDYATLVDLAEDGEHEWFCTCRYDWGPCKHAVALILAAAQAVKQGREIALLDEDDELFSVLFTEEDAAETTLEDIRAGSMRRSKKKIRAMLEERSREELIVLVTNMACEYPEVEQHLLDADQLRHGQIDPMIRALRKEIRKLTREPVWYNPLRSEGYIADYSHVRRQLQALFEAGHADEVLEIGDELWMEGLEQVEEAHDEEEVAGALSECFDVVLRALPSCSHPPARQLLWVIDRLADDRYGLWYSGEKVLQDPVYTTGDWSVVVEELERRRKLTDRGKISGREQRLALVNRLQQAYRLAGRPEKVREVLEEEVDRCQNYLQVVDHLIAIGDSQAAYKWCRHGFRKLMRNAPTVARDLRQRLKALAEAAGNLKLVVAYQALDFYERPKFDLYQHLQQLAQQAGVWSQMQPLILTYLETGQRPDAPEKKGESNTRWPLPPTEVGSIPESLPKSRFPERLCLLEIAMEEKRFDDAARWHEELHKHQRNTWRLEQKLAKAVARSNPDLSLAIWKNHVQQLIGQLKVKAYIQAGSGLRQMRRIYVNTDRVPEWQEFVAELRHDHREKARLIEVLDGLDEGCTQKSV